MRGTVAPHYIQTFRGLEATTYGRYYRRDVATVYERIDEVRDETSRQRSTAPKCRGYHYHVNCPELQERRRAGDANGANRGSEFVLLKVPTGG